jgi:hypothetical protein
MGKCSSCGLDLPGYEQLCRQCYLAQYAALEAPKDSSSYGLSAYIDLLFWIFVSYGFLTYTPGFAKVVVLGLGLVIIWCLFFWAQSKRPWKKHGTPPQHLSFILGLCCGVVWKITGADLWGRLCGACMLVSAGHRAVYRAIDWAKTARR